MGEEIKRKTNYQGIPVDIEYDKDEIRTWDWSGTTAQYAADYGYIPNTISDDDEEIDVFMVSKKRKPVYVVEKNREKVLGKPEKGWEFDESKYFLGAQNKKEVEKLFRKQFDRPQLMGKITRMPLVQFQSMVDKQQAKLSNDFRYRLQGRTKYHDIPVSIENRKGSVRKGTDADGNEWKTKMLAHYGRIPRIMGVDGDALDVFLASKKEGPVFIVHQRRKDSGKYDEDKVILGVKTKEEAKALFLKHYDSPKFLGPISQLTLDEFKSILKQYRDKKVGKITKNKGRQAMKKVSSIARYHLEKEAQYQMSPEDIYAMMQMYGPYDPMLGNTTPPSPDTYEQMQQDAQVLNKPQFVNQFRTQNLGSGIASGRAGLGAGLGGVAGAGLGAGVARLGKMKGGKAAIPMALLGALGATLGGYGGHKSGQGTVDKLREGDESQLKQIYTALGGQ
jgi:inorganic pyrophosphatase